MKLVHSADSVNTDQPSANKHEWFAAVSLSGVSHAAVRVASVLWQHMKPDGSDCFPSIPRIASMSSMCTAMVKRVRNELRDAGFLDWETVSGRVCTYKIAMGATTVPSYSSSLGGATLVAGGSYPSSRGGATPVATNTTTNTKKEIGGAGERVWQGNCTVNLCADLKAFWLEEFAGDENSLRLALMQISAYIQPNSFRPLEAQVSSQLARIAREKRERDGRYKAAALKTASLPKKRTIADVLAERGAH